MNNPFYYTPSPDCRAAADELIAWLSGKPSPFCSRPVDPAFRVEIDQGKMFGVLVVEGGETALTRGTRFHYLAGYSGQICGRSDWPAFVPAVFDYLQPNGYFKQHEAEITQLNRAIDEAAASLSADKRSLSDIQPSIPYTKGRLA